MIDKVQLATCCVSTIFAVISIVCGLYLFRALHTETFLKRSRSTECYYLLIFFSIILSVSYVAGNGEVFYYEITNQTVTEGSHDVFCKIQSSMLIFANISACCTILLLFLCSRRRGYDWYVPYNFLLTLIGAVGPAITVVFVSLHFEVLGRDKYFGYNYCWLKKVENLSGYVLWSMICGIGWESCAIFVMMLSIIFFCLKENAPAPRRRYLSLSLREDEPAREAVPVDDKDNQFLSVGVPTLFLLTRFFGILDFVVNVPNHTLIKRRLEHVALTLIQEIFHSMFPTLLLGFLIFLRRNRRARERALMNNEMIDRSR